MSHTDSRVEVLAHLEDNLGEEEPPNTVEDASTGSAHESLTATQQQPLSKYEHSRRSTGER